MNRFYQGDWIDSMASRFVDELPEEYIKKKNNFKFYFKLFDYIYFFNLNSFHFWN